jgi:NADH-quinone oxidoreductase subunit M
MSELPVLSLVTVTPFVAAVLIMAFGRTRPIAVRLIATAAASVTLALSVYLYAAYDTAAGGFQFQERYPLVRALGIGVELGADGMSVLMILLTAIIIFAGVFASWTVRVRDQEFYALLLTLVTGVFGVFVSLDLFVFFLFYEIAVLPMYLLIGIWGSTGEVRPQGIFAWAFRETGVGTRNTRR